MNRYQFDKIVKRMGDQFGMIKRGQEEGYNQFFFPIESNALKIHRNNPKANSRSFREALIMALHKINGHIQNTEVDLSAFMTSENKALLDAVLYAFDPFSNETLMGIIRKDAAIYTGEDDITELPSEYLKKYYIIPVKCVIRLIESVDTWEKAMGSDGYFKSIESTVGAGIKDDLEMDFTAPVLNKEVMDEFNEMKKTH